MNKNKLMSKQSYRQYCKKKVKNFSTISRYPRDKRVNKKILHVINQSKAKNILLYVPLQSEVDLTHIFSRLRRKKNIYVPFMEGVSFKMVKFRLPLFKKKFNIREPKNSFCLLPKLDLAIVPVLGVDGTLKRIGFGKGMYDRFFESLDYSCRIVFVQLGECITKNKLGESHDIQADLYITPHKNIIRRGQDDYRDKYSSSCCYRKWDRRLFNSKKIRCSKL